MKEDTDEDSDQAFAVAAKKAMNKKKKVPAKKSALFDAKWLRIVLGTKCSTLVVYKMLTSMLFSR